MLLIGGSMNELLYRGGVSDATLLLINMFNTMSVAGQARQSGEEIMTQDTFRFMGVSNVRIVIDSDDTGGRLAAFTETFLPGGGPPPHYHKTDIEYLVPIEGNFERFDGDSWIPLPSEGFLVQPQAIHTWRNSGSTDATMLSIFTPGGFEKFMREVANLSVETDMPRVVEAATRAGMVIIPPQDGDA